MNHFNMYTSVEKSFTILVLTLNKRFYEMTCHKYLGHYKILNQKDSSLGRKPSVHL